MRGQLRDVRVPAECPAAVEQLIAACINSDVAARPSSQEVVARLVQIIEDGGGSAVGGGDARCTPFTQEHSLQAHMAGLCCALSEFGIDITCIPAQLLSHLLQIDRQLIMSTHDYEECKARRNHHNRMPVTRGRGAL